MKCDECEVDLIDVQSKMSFRAMTLRAGESLMYSSEDYDPKCDPLLTGSLIPSTRREESTVRVDRADLTFRFRSLARLLPMFLQKQVRAGANVKLLRQFEGESALDFPIGSGVILRLACVKDPIERMDAIRGNGGDR